MIRSFSPFVLGVAVLAIHAPLCQAASTAPSRIEARFLAAPSAAGALETARYANERPHYPGTPGDYAFATYMRARLEQAGFVATIEPFRGPIDRPAQLGLALVDATGKIRRTFDLHEGPVAGDPHGTRGDAGIPFNYGSGSGDVEAPLAVVGRGLPADYAALARNHRSVRGRIALVRYGAEFRGLLAARAARNGAAGVIFYSDPRDDKARPETSVQRGTVGERTLHIPTLPVSYRTARALATSAARGDFVRLVVRLHRSTQTMWNTIGILRGRSDIPIVLGGHRDAWVFGVTDNGSGIATLLEVARAFGTLARTGWRPARTIVIAGFDAEEIGELGSQAYVRRHARSNILAYLNADEVVTGARFADDSAAAIGTTVTHVARELGVASVPAVPPIPGGGSDHESFLFAPGPGIPTAEIGFEGRLATYHSAYDDLHYALASDPGFALHRKAAQIFGLIALRLSETPRPYRFETYATQMHGAAARMLASPTFAIGTAKREMLEPLSRSIARFTVAARAYDRAPAERSLTAAIAATRVIDRAFYGATGYGDVTFPTIAAALGGGDASAVGNAVTKSARAIDGATRLLISSS